MSEEIKGKLPERNFAFDGAHVDGIANTIKEWAHRKGWHNTERDFNEWTALFHTELSEAYEEYRNGHGLTEVYFTVDSQGYNKPEGIPIELADEVIRIMHFFATHNLSLNAMLEMKMNYNQTRPFRHGGKKT